MCIEPDHKLYWSCRSKVKTNLKNYITSLIHLLLWKCYGLRILNRLPWGSQTSSLEDPQQLARRNKCGKNWSAGSPYIPRQNSNHFLSNVLELSEWHQHHLGQVLRGHNYVIVCIIPLWAETWANVYIGGVVGFVRACLKRLCIDREAHTQYVCGGARSVTIHEALVDWARLKKLFLIQSSNNELKTGSHQPLIRSLALYATARYIQLYFKDKCLL